MVLATSEYTPALLKSPIAADFLLNILSNHSIESKKTHDKLGQFFSVFIYVYIKSITYIQN